MKLTSLQVTEVALKANRLIRENKDMRMGQALMNALFEVSPDHYKAIKDSPWSAGFDPFYNDAYIPRFWSFLT